MALHHLGMWRRGRATERRDDVLEYLYGFGTMLQLIDAKLEDIVKLLGDGEDEPEE
jgi:hypothetical protein